MDEGGAKEAEEEEGRDASEPRGYGSHVCGGLSPLPFQIGLGDCSPVGMNHETGYGGGGS